MTPEQINDIRQAQSREELKLAGVGFLPELLGIEIISFSEWQVRGSLELRSELFAPNGFVHAATQIALADTLCGYGAITNLPTGGESFTTIELKANLIGTSKVGYLHCTAQCIHHGRSTQVWDATVKDDAGRNTCLFRCTQLILWPK
jgi:1,4-dihydroxy-2-naphthoyl-CoA hydrolase